MTAHSSKSIISPKIFHKCIGNSFETDEGYHEAYIEPRYEEILAYSGNNLPHEGSLSMTESGFFYLNLPNNYIFDLCLLLSKKEIELPPYFFEGFSGGAHITVALPEEKKSLYKVPELGQMVPFEITGCFYTEPFNLEGIKSIWFLSIESPAIEDLREKMGLSPLPLGQQFHITFAQEKTFLALEDFMSGADDMSITLRPLRITKDKIRRILENPSYVEE